MGDLPLREGQCWSDEINMAYIFAVALGVLLLLEYKMNQALLALFVRLDTAVQDVAAQIAALKQAPDAIQAEVQTRLESAVVLLESLKAA
jgi:outer membrane murein-binding lipoprotein Lpp